VDPTTEIATFTIETDGGVATLPDIPSLLEYFKLARECGLVAQWQPSDPFVPYPRIVVETDCDLQVEWTFENE
jgi:hypothetical protein